jgi:glycosyltransferase involved in cell wall biosynthesis
MKKKLVLLIGGEFGAIILGKECFMVPYMYGKLNEMDVEIIYHGQKKKTLPSVHRGVTLTPLYFKTNYDPFSFKGEWYYLWYILLHAPQIDVLMRWHFSYNTWLIGLIYKLRNRKGQFFIKGDDYGIFNALLRDKTKRMTRIKNRIVGKILQNQCHLADIITVENTHFYHELKNGYFGFKLGKKLKQVINGFDEGTLQQLDIHVRSFDEKENIMITVGRLGAWQKNTELLLDAVADINLKDWKVILIGPIEENFVQYKNLFFERNPQLKEHILFTGAIYNKKELWEWHNKAKVFILPSRHEGFANVYMDAVRFSNYILTTDVGGARDTLKIGNGEFLEQEDKVDLANRIQAIIDNKTPVKEILRSNPVDACKISWEHEIRKINNDDLL